MLELCLLCTVYLWALEPWFYKAVSSVLSMPCTHLMCTLHHILHVPPFQPFPLCCVLYCGLYSCKLLFLLEYVLCVSGASDSSLVHSVLAASGWFGLGCRGPAALCLGRLLILGQCNGCYQQCQLQPGSRSSHVHSCWQQMFVLSFKNSLLIACM